MPRAGPTPCDSGQMRFGRDPHPLLVTVFLAVWTIVGILYLFNALKTM
jgi:hypothetical protein